MDLSSADLHTDLGMGGVSSSLSIRSSVLKFEITPVEVFNTFRLVKVNLSPGSDYN